MVLDLTVVNEINVLVSNMCSRILIKKLVKVSSRLRDLGCRTTSLENIINFIENCLSSVEPSTFSSDETVISNVFEKTIDITKFDCF